MCSLADGIISFCVVMVVFHDRCDPDRGLLTVAVPISHTYLSHYLKTRTHIIKRTGNFNNCCGTKLLLVIYSTRRSFKLVGDTCLYYLRLHDYAFC